MPNHTQKHDDIWLFGYESYTNTKCLGGSVLDFNIIPVDTFYECRDMNLDVINVSICDTTGNLPSFLPRVCFYTFKVNGES